MNNFFFLFLNCKGKIYVKISQIKQTFSLQEDSISRRKKNLLSTHTLLEKNSGN